jgi:hypothetical protein
MQVFSRARVLPVKLILLLQMSLLALLLGVPASAEMVPDLYAAKVPVEDQSQGALATASQDALAQVLVKVSGREDVLGNKNVSAALPEARSHVLQYAYVRDPDDREMLEAKFEFDSEWVVKVLTSAGEPLLTANRPVVLVWMVVEDANGRYFVDRELSPELARLVREEFQRRGVPVRFPLFDLADSAAVSVQQVWRLDGGALQAASGRYDVDNFIAGRMVVLSNGRTTGDWSYFYDGDRSDRSFSAADATGFVGQGVAMVAESMASRYAVAPTGNVAGGVTLSVQGVQRYGDYASIVAWLETLELVERANLERVTGDLIEIRLVASADPVQLSSLIELNQRLSPLPPQAPHIQLSYQWQN